MARIGDYIQAGLNTYDPSPYLNAQANATQSIGSSIAGGIGAVGDAIDDERKKKDKVKTGIKIADAMATLYPNLTKPLAPIIEGMKSDELRLSEQAALADQLDMMINAGMQQSRDAALMDFERQRIGLEGRRVAIAEQMPQMEREAASQQSSFDNDIKIDQAIATGMATADAAKMAGVPLPEDTTSLLNQYLEAGNGPGALAAAEAQAKAISEFIKPQEGPKLTKIGGTGPTGQAIEQDVFVKGTSLFDIQGQPINALAPVDGTVLPPRDDVPQERRIQPMPQTQLGVRPMVSPIETPDQALAKSRMTGADARLSTALQSAEELAGSIDRLNQTEALLDQVKTGTFADAKVSAKRALGMDVANEEQLQTLLGEQVMAQVAKTKGAVSEKEMALFQDYSANFGKSPEGNKKIIQFAKKAATRAKKITKVINDGFQSGKSPFAIQAEIIEIQNNEPISDDLTDPSAKVNDEEDYARQLQRFATPRR